MDTKNKTNNEFQLELIIEQVRNTFFVSSKNKTIIQRVIGIGETKEKAIESFNKNLEKWQESHFEKYGRWYLLPVKRVYIEVKQKEKE